MDSVTLSQSSSPWRGWYVALISAISSAVLAATISQFSMTLQPLAEQIGVSEGQIALSDSLKTGAIVIAMLIAPVAIQKLGMKVTYYLSIILFLVSQSAIPYVGSYTALALFKVMQSFATLLFPLLLVLIVEANDTRNVGFATAIFTGIFYAGSTVGGTIASMATAFAGWRFSYHILSILLVVLSSIFVLTVPMRGKVSESDAGEEGKGAYRAVVTDKITWYLIVAFLPTIWTVQAIGGDITPFGLTLGYSELEMGEIMGVSSVAILIAALISGKISDIAAGMSSNKLGARVLVLAAGALMICLGVALLLAVDLQAPNRGMLNAVTFLLSFGSAWGLGSFYCIMPEAYVGEGITVANAFAGGVADLAMPLALIVMAVVGIEMNRWGVAWLSCVAVSVLGIVAALLILKEAKQRVKKHS